MNKPYCILNPVYSSMGAQPAADMEAKRLAFITSLPSLRFSKVFVTHLKSDPNHKVSWGLAREWSHLDRPSIIGYGFSSEAEAQKECDRLNKLIARQQGSHA